MSGPLHNVGYPFRIYGHDKHAPPTLGGTRLSGPPHNDGYPFRIYGHDKHAPPTLGGTHLSGPSWRDALVASAARCWIIYPDLAGTTSVPLRFVCRVTLKSDTPAMPHGLTGSTSSFELATAIGMAIAAATIPPTTTVLSSGSSSPIRRWPRTVRSSTTTSNSERAEGGAV